MAALSVVFTLLMLVGDICAMEAEQVNTTLGPIRGLRQHVLDKVVDVYYGIPFAKPPVGDLRFKRPEPAEPWTDVMSTVTKPNACPQTIDTSFDQFPGVDMWNPNTPISEDCLYLNVWVPRGLGANPRTTMVWIYGGGFYSGSSALDVYDGSKLAVSQNVIVASMNYRLGPLGFLYTGTLDAPGNQGLLDQALALKWIYDNVVSFGGQQDSITIFGESAGSISVSFHLVSPKSTDYFTRAIMQSGSFFMDVAMLSQKEAKRRSSSLARMFNCSQPLLPVSKMIECLRKVDAQQLTDKQWSLETPGRYLEIPVAPVVDDHFLPGDPRTLLKQRAVKDTELLVGVTKDEGSYFLVYGFPQLFPLQSTPNISDAEFKELMSGLTFPGKEAVTKALTYEYVDISLPASRDSYWNIADDISGDSLIKCPTVDFANAFAALKGRRDVYLYSFEHRLSNDPWPDWTGVMHGYEIEPVFGLPLPFNYTQAELDLADRMMGYWTRFAETGTPTAGEALVWPKLTVQEAQYLKLTAQGDSVEQGLHRQHCSFLSTILPLLESSVCTTAKGRVLFSSSPLVVSMACVSALWSSLTLT